MEATMNAMDCIFTRRSVRQFTEQPVSREQVEALVAAAAYAPSWKNTQTSRYVAVADPALRQTIADDCVLGFAGNRRIIGNAPVLMVLTTVEGSSGYNPDGSFTTVKGSHWQSFDAGISCQTFCLAAHAQGLATVIMGLFDGEKIAQLLQLPAGQSVSALIALGHPAISPQAPSRLTAEALLTWK